MAAEEPPGVATPSPVAGDYAPSPNTSSVAVARANQLRVQTLLRRLLSGVGGPQHEDDDDDDDDEGRENWRIDTLRVLRKTLRELNFQLSWLTQVELLETLARILVKHDEVRTQIRTQDQSTCSWRLVHDATQLLLETLPQLSEDVQQDEQVGRELIDSVIPEVVKNLGHTRSEVRRASLLLLNLMLRQFQRQHQFQAILKLFIKHGLENRRHPEAQRGAILSLPLLLSPQLVERHSLEPLINCLGALLANEIDDDHDDDNRDTQSEANERLFYSLYLALQRLHLMLGDSRFFALMERSSCGPQALHLYRQAASRQNSLVGGMAPDCSSGGGRGEQLIEKQQHVTFEQAATNEELAKQPEVPAESTQANLQTGSRLSSRSGSESGLDEKLTSGADSISGSSSSSATGPTIRQAEQSVEKRRQFSSDVSSTCSSNAHLVNPAHYMTRAALEGNPMANYEQIHHVDHSAVCSLAINDFGPICNTPTIELGPNTPTYLSAMHPSEASPGVGVGGQVSGDHSSRLIMQEETLGRSELKFGILPRQLVSISLNNYLRSSDRLEAMQELMCIVRESPVNHLAILMTYFDSFLEHFVSRLLLGDLTGTGSGTGSGKQQPQIKLALVAIDMLETIVIKTKVSTMQYIRPIVSVLMRSLAINQSQLPACQLVREQATRVVHKMMAYLPPQHVIDAVFEHKHSRAEVVREETVNRVTAAILDYDPNEFNLTRLCYHVLPMLADHEQQVRLAALECIATLAHALGPARIGSLLTAAEAVQTNCDYDGLLDAINARLQRHSLPRCQPNGFVRHLLRPLLTGSGAMAGSPGGDAMAADVRWVLEAPSMHQHPGGHAYHPHQHHRRASSNKASAPEVTPQPEEEEHHHQHHRLGVYSPPTQAERRRRSSVAGVNLLVGAGHEHHHRKQKSSSHEDEPAEAKPEVEEKQHERRASGAGHAAQSSRQQQPRPQRVTPRNKSRSLPHGTGSEPEAAKIKPRFSCDCAPGECAPTSSTSDTRAKAPALAGSGRESAQTEVASGQGAIRRQGGSSEDESVSSTGTNKLLFQYYLGKFRQSLADSPFANSHAENNNNNNNKLANQRPRPPVLPSDSLIYADDVSLAYVEARQKSRYQQTSFERDEHDEQQQQKLSPGGGGSRVMPEPEMSGPTERSGSGENSARVRGLQTQKTLRRQASVAVAPPAPPTQQQQQVDNSVRTQEDDELSRGSSSKHRGAGQQATVQVSRRKSSSGGAEQTQLERAESEKTRVTRNESDTTASSMSSNCDNNCQQPARRESTVAALVDSDSTVDEENDSTTGRLHRSKTTARNSADSGRAAAAAAGATAASRRRASRSQPPSASSRRAAAAADSRRQSAAGQSDDADDDDEQHHNQHNNSTNRRPTNAKQLEMATTSGRRAISVSPSLSNSINIRNILENVAQVEGDFVEPQLALKVAMDALDSPCWSTKVEGILALIRLAAHHPQTLVGTQTSGQHLHEVVVKLAHETGNLRSTVARSAIFALGDFCARLGRHMEPEMDLVCKVLLQKSNENTSFIRDDIRRALDEMVQALTPWRLAKSLITHGSQHKSANVRRMASQFVATLVVDRLGPAKCLVGAREISSSLLPAACKFAQDNSPHTRYYGRLILSKLMHHGSFDRLLRRLVSSSLYRSTVGIIESVKRRGPGELPQAD